MGQTQPVSGAAQITDLLAQTCQVLDHPAGLDVGPHLGATAPAKLDQSFVTKPGVGTQHGVHVDVESGGNLPSGGQPLPRLELAGRHRATDLSGNLVGKTDRTLWVHPEQHVCMVLEQSSLIQTPH